MPSKATKKKSTKQKKAAEPKPKNKRTPNVEPTPSPQSATTSKDKNKKKYNINLLVDTLFTSLSPDAPSDSAKKRDKLIQDYIKYQINQSTIANKYNILILHDEGRMVKSDADHIYSAATSFSERNPILLVLYSSGGFIDSAYLIGKLCREYSCGKFIVVVPRQAKSGATLICCAADEIHMGSLSELGPIDPQIDNLPALGLKASIEHIADLVKHYPHASDMFAKYLNMSLKPIHLGYFERVAESAVQYAERLLKAHSSNLKQKPTTIAKDLVYSYKDHGFVIDKTEATTIFGENIVKKDTNEYELGNRVYSALMFISRLARVMHHYFYFIGSSESEPHFKKRE